LTPHITSVTTYPVLKFLGHFSAGEIERLLVA